jgi:diguanylate cyclase (GGDEF)-like protein/PAS domain S-box-containing protein
MNISECCLETASFLDLLEAGLIVTDENLTVHHWNRWLETHTKIGRSEIVDRQLTDFFPDLETTVLKRKIKTALQLKSATFYRPLGIEYFIPVPIKRFIQHDVHYMYQRVTISSFDPPNGLVLISVYDETEAYITRKQLEKEHQTVLDLNSELQQGKKIIDENLMLLRTDLDGTIMEASSALQEFFGYTQDELIGKRPSIFRHSDMPSVLFKELWKTIINKKSWRGEIKNQTKSGNVHWLDATVLPFLDSNGDTIYYTAIYNDITDKKRLEHLSETDPLTKLHNRGYFDRIFDYEFSGKRRELLLSLMIIDIDFFKKINDTYGHRTGDLVLIEFAKILASSIRNSDYCARIGGEEFTIVLPNTNLEDARKAAEKIRRHVARTEFPKVGKVSCSVGIAMKESGEAKEALFERADRNLYTAKTEGRDRIIG